MAARVTIVEDDRSIAELLIFNFENAGFQVTHYDNGDDGYFAIVDAPPDIAILDWMLPDLSGIDICRRLRADDETKSLPIVMLTARGEEDDRIRGLELGADDYITKPFSVRELISRVNALLRRAAPEATGQALIIDDINLDPLKKRVMRGKRPVRLGPKEFDVLEYLMTNPGRVYSREQLLDRIWGVESDIDFRTVDVVIRRLRRALNRGDERDPIRTVRASGYAFDETYQA